MTASVDGRNRLYLHVGVPKSGTTFLQRALLSNQDGLREAGFLYPGADHEEMFRAAMDVRSSYETWGRKPEDVAGAWQRLCTQARAFDGTSIISHEILGAASPEQASSRAPREASRPRGPGADAVAACPSGRSVSRSADGTEVEGGGTWPTYAF